MGAESRFKLKHSLDSDEEDEKDEVKDSRLGDEDLAAQEDTTIVRMQPSELHYRASCVPCYDVYVLTCRSLMMVFK